MRSPCDTCPGKEPTQPFPLPKGGRIEIHCHPADHDFRVLSGGPVMLLTQGQGPRTVQAGESVHVGKGDRHSAVAVEDAVVHCDFGLNATEADTHPMRGE